MLDALHVLFMSRSFVSSSDAPLVMHGASGFEVMAELTSNVREAFSLTCLFNRAEGKKFFVNGSPLTRLTDLIGLVPVVVLSPDDRKLTKEGPAERRAFLDAMISQVSKKYLLDLVDYRKVLKQRNRLLTDYYGASGDIETLLEPWDVQLARIGAAIMAKRQETLKRLAPLFTQIYERLQLPELKPELAYSTSDFSDDLAAEDDTEKEYELQLLRQLSERRSIDLERGMTTVGPHRDDLVFSLGGKDLRKFGSQGQHRLFAIALKLAQLEWFAAILDEPPLLMLDDVFGELDAQKTSAITALLTKHPFQTFISVAKEGLIVPHLDEHASRKLFIVEDGNVVTG